jgi:hypothetical protein
VLAQTVGDVLTDGDRIEERSPLEEHRDASAHERHALLGHRRDLVAVEGDRASVGVEQADEQLEHHALADARAAEDGDRLAGEDVEIETSVDELRPEGFLHPAEADERLGHVSLILHAMSPLELRAPARGEGAQGGPIALRPSAEPRDV